MGRRIAFALWLIFLGALLGIRVVWSWGQDRGSGTPEGWSRTEVQAPFRRTDVVGDLPLSPFAWNLDHYEALLGPSEVERFEVELILSVTSAVTIFPAANEAAPPDTAGLLLEPSGQGAVGVYIPNNMSEAEREALGAIGESKREQPLDCEGSLPHPGAGPYAVTLTRRGGGFVAESGGQTLTCPGAGPDGAGPPVIGSGLARAQVRRVSSEAWTLEPPTERRWLWLALLGGVGLLGALSAAERAVGVSRAAVAGGAAPLLLLLGVLTLDGAVIQESIRLNALPPRWLPLIVGVLPAVGVKALIWAGALGRAEAPGPAEHRRPMLRDPKIWWPLAPVSIAGGLGFGWIGGPLAGIAAGLAFAIAAPILAAVLKPLTSIDGPGRSRGAIGALLPAAVAALTCGLLQTEQLWAATYFSLAGVLAGLVTWANVNAPRVRGFNWISLALAALALVQVEYGTRWTGAGVSWSLTGGRAGADAGEGDPSYDVAVDVFAAIERGGHTQYPISHAPVAYPPPSDSPRLVSFGGSATAGAPQNESVEEFYPARIRDQLDGRIDVVNQGVGGWNTFHIKTYALKHLQHIQPDIVTIYVGHNDQFFDIPRTTKEQYALWSGNDAAREVGAGLHQIRLYQGLRFMVESLRPSGNVDAVPVEHARENLREIITAARSQGARVLLMSEAIDPDPSQISDYWEMMADLAAELGDDVAYLDTATPVVARGGLFLDNVHLTYEGHVLVAELAVAELKRLGWVE